MTYFKICERLARGNGLPVSKYNKAQYEKHDEHVQQLLALCIKSEVYGELYTVNYRIIVEISGIPFLLNEAFCFVCMLLPKLKGDKNGLFGLQFYCKGVVLQIFVMNVELVIFVMMMLKFFSAISCYCRRIQEPFYPTVGFANLRGHCFLFGYLFIFCIYCVFYVACRTFSLNL